MNTPRSGFRRSAIASWALAGLGVAGVAGTSALAYADTYKPQVAELPVVVVEDPAPEMMPAPQLDAPQLPIPVPTELPAPANVDAPPIPTAAPAVAPAPVTNDPAPAYTPRQTAEPTQAPATHESTAPSTPPTAKRRSVTPSVSSSPKFSPHTVARGS